MSDDQDMPNSPGNSTISEASALDLSPNEPTIHNNMIQRVDSMPCLDDLERECYEKQGDIMHECSSIITSDIPGQAESSGGIVREQDGEICTATSTQEHECGEAEKCQVDGLHKIDENEFHHNINTDKHTTSLITQYESNHITNTIVREHDDHSVLSRAKPSHGEVVPGTNGDDNTDIHIHIAAQHETSEDVEGIFSADSVENYLKFELEPVSEDDDLYQVDHDMFDFTLGHDSINLTTEMDRNGFVELKSDEISTVNTNDDKTTIDANPSLTEDLNHNEQLESIKITANENTHVQETPSGLLNSMKSQIVGHSANKYSCDICNHGFARATSYKHHMKLHENQSDGALQSDLESSSEGKIVLIQDINNKLHDCLICGKKLSRAYELKQHMLQHEGEESHQCLVCEKTFVSAKILKRHGEVHTRKRSHVCQVCGKSYFNKSHLKEHSVTHTKEYPHFCHVCGKGFASNSKFNQHSLVHSGEKSHRCLRCSNTFVSIGALNQHLKNHDKCQTCSECGKLFAKISDLKRHMMSHTGEKSHYCVVCGKGFCVASSLNRHMTIHTGLKPFPCNECGKAFLKNSDLKRHLISHSREKGRCCLICGTDFMSAEDLNHHMKSHSCSRPHSCSMCDKSFIRASDLKIHQMTHSGERNHFCSICSKGFIKRSDLKRHTMIHTGERTHFCEVCGKGFVSSSHLKDHIMTHTGQKPFPCAECDQGFRRASELKRHMTRIHPEMSE